jgi:quercetin dioxygenase-like cupin family protein
MSMPTSVTEPQDRRTSSSIARAGVPFAIRVEALATENHQPCQERILMPNDQFFIHRASAIKHQPRADCWYFDVAIGSVCLTGEDTGGAYCLIEACLAPGIGVPRHMHTREDEAYYVLSGELEVTVAGECYVLGAGDTLMAPRGIPHQLRNSGDQENHYLLVFSPSGFENFLKATAIPAPPDAVAPNEPPAVAVRNVHALAEEYGIEFG